MKYISNTIMATKKGKLSMRAVKLLTLLVLMSTGALQAQYGWWGSQDTLNLYNRNMGSVMIGATQPLGKLTLGADDQMYNLSLIGDWSNMGKNYLRVGVMGNRSNNLQGHVLFDLTHGNNQPRYAGYNFRVNGMSHFFINGDGNVGIGTEKPEARLDIKGGPDWYGFNVGLRMPKNNMIRFDAGQAQYGLVALEDEVSFVTSNGSPTAFGSMFSKRFSIQPRKTIIYGDLEVRGNIYSPGFNNGGGNGSGNPTGGGNGDGDSGKDGYLPPGEGDDDPGGGGVATEYWTQDASMNLYYLPSTGTGNVGIGTTSPTLAKFVVSGAAGGNTVALFGDVNPVSLIKDSPIIGFNTYYNSGWKVFTASKYTGIIGLNPTDGSYFFNTGNNPSTSGWGATMTERMRISNTGNVGIGTSSPSQKLDVAARAKFRSDGTVGAGFWLTDNSGTEQAFFGANGTTSSSQVGFWHGGAWRMVVTSTGLVGIGTTNPDANYKLSVNGKIKAQELYLTTTGWSDFVFDKNYKLRSLSEVERHIKEYKHLPDVPSEKEVIKNGVGVVEMQAKLLQKIEELTLYVIELEKKNAGMQKEMNDLKKLVNDVRLHH